MTKVKDEPNREVISDVDALRTPENLLNADARSESFVAIVEGRVRKFTQADHHAEITRFELNQSVPIEVRIHFETAKNLYLYAWFVYRFYPVAEQQALTSLEFALRHRLRNANVRLKKLEKMGLSDLLSRPI